MPTVTCAGCDATLRVPEEAAGNFLRCPRCQTLLAIPAPAEEPKFEVVREEEPPLDLPIEAPSNDRPAYRPARRSRRPRRKEHGPFDGIIAFFTNPAMKSFMAIAGGCAFFGGMVLYFAWTFFVGPAPKEIAADQWKPHEIPGRYKVLMPAQPTQQSQAAGGMKVILYGAEPDKQSMYAVGYSEGQLPPERLRLSQEALLNDACDGAVANSGGTQVSREPCKLGNYVGKELVVRIPRGSGKLISRVFLTRGGRLYIVMCGGRGFEPGQPNVKRFLDSFEITEGGAPPPRPPAIGRPPL